MVPGKINWLAALFQLGLIILIHYLYYISGVPEPFIWAALTYVLISFLLRNVFSMHFKAARYLIRKQRYSEAIPYIVKSLEYYEKRKWVDTYRFITLLSISKTSYRVMNLCHLAFCYAQVGQGEKAEEYYRKVLHEDRDNGLAMAALKMMTALQKEN